VPFRISALQPEFPDRLRYNGGPPHVEVEGPLGHRLDSLRHPIAIVGTRHPSPEARDYARFLARTLAEAGMTIVSGGALGIDTEAHLGALEAGKPTIAVLPTSVETPQPSRNAQLFARIAKTGALVAFRDAHEQPRFHERNAAIAALVDDVILAAAPIKSGARNTAAEARRRTKCELWVVPGAPWDSTMEGCALELTLGCRILISPQPIMRKYGLKQNGIGSHKVVVERRSWQSNVTFAGAPASSSTARRTTVTHETILPSPDERRLRDALAEGPATVDELVLRTALPVAPVRALLLTWSIEGVVREGPVGLFRLLSI
jgi:DNA processing protein